MIIGLTGYARVGKDTLCQKLENYERAAFADVLKQEVGKMLESANIEADLWGEDKEEWRELLVYWGRRRRQMDRDYWIQQLAMRLWPLNDKRICVTDVRYLNECRWVEKHGGFIIGIERPGHGPANDEEAVTIREIRIQKPEIPWLVNDGTPDDLMAHARSVIKTLSSRQMKGRVLY